MKILVVDDDAMTHELVSAVIRVLGEFEILRAHDGVEALAMAEAHEPDLIVSDINMPDMDGLALCRQLRAHPRLATVPILLLTARGETSDKYEGFLQGADDYLVKPFDIMELQLRIKALLRRASWKPGDGEAQPTPEALLEVGALVLNPRRSSAVVDAREVRLTASEFALLRLLASRPDQLVAAEELLVEALGYPPRVGNPQTIHSHIRNVRGKFRQAGVEPVFLTSSHQGYLLTSQTAG